MFHFDEIEIGRGPMPRCRRCVVTRDAAFFETADELLPRIARVTAASEAFLGPNVILVGAEPFAHPALPALLAEAVRCGAERIGLVTDGGALGIGGNAAGIVHAGVRYVIVRSLGLGAVADELSGRAGLSQRVRDGLSALRIAADAAGITIAVAVEIAVCRHNQEGLPASVASCAEAGVGCVRLMQEADAIPLPVSVTATITAACDTGAVNGVWVEVAGLPVPESHALHRVGVPVS